jgi:hypothetical protein
VQLLKISYALQRQTRVDKQTIDFLGGMAHFQVTDGDVNILNKQTQTADRRLISPQHKKKAVYYEMLYEAS